MSETKLPETIIASGAGILAEPYRPGVLFIATAHHNDEALAAEIARRWNAHERLVAMLERCTNDGLAEYHALLHGKGKCDATHCMDERLIAEARALLSEIGK